MALAPYDDEDHFKTLRHQLYTVLRGMAPYDDEDHFKTINFSLMYFRENYVHHFNVSIASGILSIYNIALFSST